MAPRKKRKLDLINKDASKCLELIDNNDHKELLKKLNAKLVKRPVYPDGTESSKTLLICYAIKKEKQDCVNALSSYVDVKKAFTNCRRVEGVCYENYSSSSAIHYCIEKKCSADMLNLLLSLSDHELVTESYVKSAIVASNVPALDKLLYWTNEYFNLSATRGRIIENFPIRLKHILAWYSDHPNVEILNTLLNGYSYINWPVINFKIIDGLPTLIYLANQINNFSLEESELIIKFCVSLGCDVNARQGSDVPLHVSMEANNRNIFKALIRCGSNIRRLNSEGRSALYEALLQKDDDLFKFLLANGADSLQHNIYSDRDCALHYVLRNKDIDRLCQIIELDSKLNVSGKNGRLLPAVFNILQYLIETEMSKLSATFLVKILRTCMKLKFDVNTKCKRSQIIHGISFKGHTILHLGIRFLSTTFCEELIKLGADPNNITDYNQCAYSLTMDCVLEPFGISETAKTISYNRIAFIKKQDIDLTNKLPLPQNEKFPLVYPYNRFLYLSDKEPRTPLQILLSTKRREVIELLYKFVITPGSLQLADVDLAMQTGSFFVTHFIMQEVSKEVNLSSVNVSNFKYMFTTETKSAAKPDYPEKLSFTDECLGTLVLQGLSTRGLNFNAVDDCGNSIFHYAARSQKFAGKESIDNFFNLIMSYAGYESVDRVNKLIQSPLYWALSINSPCSEHLVKTFLNFGAEFRRKTYQGYSAIHIAVNSGSISYVEQLIEKSGPKKNVVNLWRKLPCAKIQTPFIDGIEEVSWPYSAISKYYIITPLTIAIMKKNKDMIKVLMGHGAILDKRDIHNSLYLTSLTDFAMTNIMFEYVAEDFSFQFDRVENNVPTLEYIFYKLSNEGSSFDSDALLTFTKNYVSRKYDINEKHCYYPPVLVSLIKWALRGKGHPVGNTNMFTYLMNYSDCNFVAYKDSGESLLTHLLRGSCPLSTCSLDADDGHYKINRKIAPQRKYFIRMLLQRCCYSKWTACHFDKYIYHWDDDDILDHLLFTGARNNLVKEFPQVEMCHLGTDTNVAANYIGLDKFLKKIQSPPLEPATLLELSVMAIGKLSEDMRTSMSSFLFPAAVNKMIQFLDVETDDGLSWELYTCDE